MKKIILFLSVIVLMTSCSKSEEQPVTNPTVDTSGVLVKKIRDFMQSNPANTTSEVFLTYNGNKLDEIDFTQVYGYIEKYTYVGNLITKLQYVTNNVTRSYVTYTYVNSNLDESIFYDISSGIAERKKYIYNSDGTVSYRTYSGNHTSQNTLTYTGTLTYLQNGEIGIYTRKDVNGIDAIRTSTYDDKNSPFKNITGYEKIKKWRNNFTYPVGTFHNELSWVYGNEVFNYSYLYNTDGFASSCVETENTGAKRIIEYTYY